MAKIPKWTAISLVPLEFAVVLVLAPYFLSQLSARHGWTDGRPGAWNVAGLVLVATGAIGIMWAVSFHVTRMESSVQIETTPKYLLQSGPYRFSRNPIYVSVLTIWLGWTIVYGSAANGAVLLMAWAIITLVVVPLEERRLESRFGDSYRQYKNAVGRWFGGVGV